MALQVWLPFDGDTNNRGLSDIKLTGSPNSWNTSGKIGSCAVFAGSTSNVIYNNTSEFNYTDNFSWCAWINTNYTDTGAHQYVFTVGRADYGGYGYGLRNNSATLCTCRFGNAIYNVNVANGEWTHIAFTKKGTNIRIYKNGELYSNNTFSGTLPTYSDGNGLGIGCFHISYNIYPYRGSLNDFRIYNHCLSQEEVHEISQGLILHYPLDNPYNTSLTNMLPIDYQLGNSSARSTCITKTKYDGYYKYVLNYTGTGSNIWPNIYIKQVTSSLGWVAGTTYTFYIKFRINSHSSSVSTFAFRAARLFNDYYGCNSKNMLSSEYCDGNWHTISISQNIPATFTYNSSTITCTGPYPQIFMANLSASGTLYTFDIDIAECAVYASSTTLPFVYTNFKDTIVQDCSGYWNNGTATNIIYNANTPRYSCSTYFNGTDSIIAAGRGAMVTDEITFMGWCKTSVASPKSWFSCTENGGWNMSQGTYIQSLIYAASGYRYATSSKTYTSLGLNTWHHFASTWNGYQAKLYIDGILAGSSTALTTKTAITYHASNGIFIGGESASTTTIPTSYSNVTLSDVRIYATALSAADIKKLYECGGSIDNLGNLHCGEMIEDDNQAKQQVKKDTRILCNNITELPLKYDDKIYTESDGSMWIRIVRQNNPASNIFSSTDSFSSSVYKNDDIWFYASLCNYVDKWELMIKQVPSSSDTESKFRWVQSYNPMTATFANVSSANVTYNTSSEYTATTYGGLYYKNSNVYICANDGNSNNWWGGIGFWENYGDHSLAGFNATLISTGYSDLYLRIDNVTFTGLSDNSKVQFLKSVDINANEIKEI